jgi:hypothetical protein
MRATLPELAILNLTEHVTEDEPEYMPADMAWRCLDDEVKWGRAPADLGRDLTKWAAWVDWTYTRLHREACSTANYRILKPATATGSFRPAVRGFARVVLAIEPIPDSSTITVETSRCIAPFAYQPSAEDRERFLTAATEGIHEMAARLRVVGFVASILEIHVHPHDSTADGFRYAAKAALKESVTTAGTEAI